MLSLKSASCQVNTNLCNKVYHLIRKGFCEDNIPHFYLTMYERLGDDVSVKIKLCSPIKNERNDMIFRE